MGFLIFFFNTEANMFEHVTVFQKRFHVRKFKFPDFGTDGIY